MDELNNKVFHIELNFYERYFGLLNLQDRRCDSARILREKNLVHSKERVLNAERVPYAHECMALCSHKLETCVLARPYDRYDQCCTDLLAPFSSQIDRKFDRFDIIIGSFIFFFFS